MSRAYPVTDRPPRMTTPERATLALLALSGAAFLPGALNRFVFPKLTCVAAALALAALVPTRGRLPRPAVRLLAAGAGVLMVAALVGPDPVAQLLGRAPRYEGVFGLGLYIGAGAAGARLLGLARARGSTAWFLRWLSIAAVAIAIEAVLEAAGLRPLASNVSRPGSLLGNASDEGAWGVLALGPLAASWLRTRHGWWLAAGALAAGTTIVCSASRGALVGAVLLAAVLAVTLADRRARVAIALGLVCVAAGTFALPSSRQRVTGASPLATQTVTGRRLLWSETLTLLAGRPALGEGPSGYVDAIPAFHDAHYERVVGPQSPPDSPHDWLLQAAVAGGLALLALALALAALTLRRGWAAIGAQASTGEAAAVAGMLAGLAGYGAALLFHLTSPGTTPLAAVFGGALLSAAPKRAAPRRAARAVCAAAVAVALVMASAAAAEIPLRSAILDAAGGHLSAADARFRLARDLRPWDREITATAAHAYAVLARDGFGAAIAPGMRWVRDELSAFPHSIQALSDAALLDLAAGERAAAAARVSAALRLEPQNPALAALRALANGG